ncbi:MAG: flavin reductase [bacterium]|nr:flavin reductase [bacterium]
MSFKEITAKQINKNAIELIADEWALVAAGDKNGSNMMTVSWGFFGEMWGKDCVIAMIRPQRYTIEFLNKHDHFALCFMGENNPVHKICGSVSGRDTDKLSATGLTPIYNFDTVFYEQARQVLICKKIYTDEIKESGFIDKDCLKWYKDKDFHRVFIGQIEKVLIKED